MGNRLIIPWYEFLFYLDDRSKPKPKKVPKKVSLFWSYCHAGNLEGIKTLHEQGFDIHVDNESGLAMAALHGHLHVVEYLVENGCTHVNCAFIRACELRHVETARYLLQHGADINLLKKRAAESPHITTYQFMDQLLTD